MAAKATLLHNPKASQGRWSAKALLAALEDGGYEAYYHSTKTEGWREAVEQGEGLLIIAGGDGTVGKICKLPASSGRRIAILPTGGANNVATSLGIVGQPDELARRLTTFQCRTMRIGRVGGLAESDSFIEAAGVGALTATVGMVDNDMNADRKRAAGRSAFQRTLREANPLACELLLDGKPWKEEALFLEIMIIPITGPSLPLATGHDPGADRFAVVWLAPVDRGQMIGWLESPETSRPPLQQISARHVILQARERLRIDDEIVGAGSDVVLSLEGRQVEVLVHPDSRAVA